MSKYGNELKRIREKYNKINNELKFEVLDIFVSSILIVTAFVMMLVIIIN